MNNFSHSFALCAYKESPHLRACLDSLKAQTLPSPFFIATSTPNAFIDGLAKEYGIPVYVSERESGIGRDWNFAVSCADTDFVTIAHQDDLYEKDYAKSLNEYAAMAKDPLLLFTDYGELRGDDKVYDNQLLNIKRKINTFFKPRIFWKSRFVRNRLLSIGSSICCPSVCLHKKLLPDFRFNEQMTCDLDWDAWSRLARLHGSFVYIPRPLMLHRIHEESETTRQMSDGNRFSEDYEMFCRYWPKWIAKMLMKRYAGSAENNEL